MGDVVHCTFVYYFLIVKEGDFPGGLDVNCLTQVIRIVTNRLGIWE